MSMEGATLLSDTDTPTDSHNGRNPTKVSHNYDILHHSLNLVGRIFPHKCKIASVDQLMALCLSPHS